MSVEGRSKAYHSRTGQNLPPSVTELWHSGDGVQGLLGWLDRQDAEGVDRGQQKGDPHSRGLSMQPLHNSPG